MQQSNNGRIQDKVAFLYERLSRDDDLEGESYSIINQKKLLTKVAKEKGYTRLVHFYDDGISGVTMDRPEFNKMLEQLELGKASAVFVKDLSRLGRNYIEVGRLTDDFFPEHNIRLVAVSDNIDSDEGENEFAPIKNLFNEWYARDISKKRRASNRVKGNSGVPLGPPPYGYMKNPDNSGFWIVDDEPAQVIKRIDKLTLSGYGTVQIADMLSAEKILTPTAYANTKGIRKPSKNTNADPYGWNASTIVRILTMQEYCGDVINFKTYSKSYKNKKRYQNAPENISVFKDVHEPIRDRSTFETIQAQRGKVRKRKMRDGERNIFSGLLVCADCGSNMNFHFNQGNPDIQYFNCAAYNRGKRKNCTSTHYIRVDFLEQIVLAEIRRLTRFVCQYEDEFTAAVANYSKKAIETERKIRQGELKSLITRDKELDVLFEKIYEDNVSGKISDERFAKLSAKYETEQKSISERIAELKKLFDEVSTKIGDTESFVAAVRKYTRVKKLTPLMLNELIERIEIHQAEIIGGEQTQTITIHYNCIGAITIPEELSIPEPQITVQTRKGVAVSYAPMLSTVCN